MLANAPPQGKGCGPPGPNPFPHRSLMHRRNASPHRFLVRSSKPLQSAFPFPQEERQPSQIPRAQIQTPSERISVPAGGTPALTDSSCADPNPFRAHFRSRKRNASPHRLLVRRSNPLQSAFPFPQEEHKTLTIPPARETQNCTGNADLRGKRGIARETRNCVLRNTESEHGNRSKERSVLKKDCFEHGDK